MPQKLPAVVANDCVLIEPGSGNSEKVRLLLDAVQPSTYLPVDISAEFPYASAVELGRDFPWLGTPAICADFAERWHARTRLPEGRRIIFYPGSTIGTMHPERAKTLLSELRKLICGNWGVLVGVDLHKSTQRLKNAAYNDAKGITAEVNLQAQECEEYPQVWAIISAIKLQRNKPPLYLPDRSGIRAINKEYCGKSLLGWWRKYVP